MESAELPTPQVVLKHHLLLPFRKLVYRMKKKLAFIVPTILLLAFLAFKPPAIGSEKGDVVVTPTSTFTPTAKPHLRDFDDEGREPRHSVEEEGEGLHPDKGHHEDGDENDHEDDLDRHEDESDDD